MLKQKGKVRNLGLGNCGVMLQSKFPDSFVSNQLPYSLIWRGIEFEILKKRKHHLNTFIFYSCFGQGLLSSKYKDIDSFPQSRKRSRLFNYFHCNSRHREEGYEQELNTFLIKYHEICERNRVHEAYASLGWILARIENSITLIGLRNIEQVKLISKISLINDAIINEMTRISEDLKNKIGSKIDLWSSIERIK